jgi:6-phosphogluconolactonase
MAATAMGYADTGPSQADSSRHGRWAGAVFAMSNSINNQIVSYGRAADGSLTKLRSQPTGGNGIGVDLDTQGGLRLSSDHRFLYAVNAGSDDISVFSVDGTRIRRVQKIYAGDQPNSLTIHDDLLYVLDGSVAGNGIRGFRVGENGTLTALPDSFRKLSSPIAVPGQVEFSPDGNALLVTHKTTNVLMSPQNAIDLFSVGADGTAAMTPVRDASNGLRPFALAFRGDGTVAVVESFNAAPNASATSSYRVSATGQLDVISGSVPNNQTDTCWIVISKDDQFAFTANFGSGTISSYRFGSDGAMTLLEGAAASTGDTSEPVDLAMSADGQYLYMLLRGTGGVAEFGIDGGHLSSLGVVVGGLPVADGASGLAAY